MKFFKKVSLVIFFLFLSTGVSFAKAYVQADYDFMLDSWAWILGASKSFGWVTIGADQISTLDGYATKPFGIPSGIPIKQGYRLWAETEYKSFTFRLEDWCDHWLSQSGVFDKDKWGLVFSVRYDF